MTVASVERKAGPYAGNDVATSFAFDFSVFSSADVQVQHTSVGGVVTVLTLNVDYSVTLNGDQNVDPGGSVTYPISGLALGTGQQLAIIGNTEYSQGMQLPNGGAFNAVAIERALDKLTMLTQQLREELARAVKLPGGEEAGSLPGNREGKLLTFNATTGVPELTSFTAANVVSGAVTDGDKGDIVVSATGTTWEIDARAVTLAKQADIATSRLMGRVTASSGVQEALTGTQATTLLDVFTPGLKGLAPASGGGTTNFLRADGTWAAAGGGGSAALNDLTDVVLTAPAGNEALVYDGANWVNTALGTAIQTSGTFTPELFGFTTAGAGTYGPVSGNYTMIGNVVTFDISLVWYTHTGTGNLYLTGLPFACLGANAPVGVVFSSGTHATKPGVIGLAGGTDIFFVLPVSGTGLTNLQVVSAGEVFISGTCRAS